MGILTSLEKFLMQKNKEYEDKRKREEAAVLKNMELQQSNYLRAFLSPHLKKILAENLYFQSINEIYLKECTYEKDNNLWKVSMEVILPNPFRIKSPQVLTSLNETKDGYFYRLDLDYQFEMHQLALMAEAENSNPVNIRLEYEQIQRKYDLLNHRIEFKSIEFVDLYDSVKIWLIYR